MALTDSHSSGDGYFPVSQGSPPRLGRIQGESGSHRPPQRSIVRVSLVARLREWQALRRAHVAHLRELGDDLDRGEEFDTALDLREVVVIGKA